MADAAVSLFDGSLPDGEGDLDGTAVSRTHCRSARHREDAVAGDTPSTIDDNDMSLIHAGEHVHTFNRKVLTMISTFAGQAVSKDRKQLVNGLHFDLYCFARAAWPPASLTPEEVGVKRQRTSSVDLDYGDSWRPLDAEGKGPLSSPLREVIRSHRTEAAQLVTGETVTEPTASSPVREVICSHHAGAASLVTRGAVTASSSTMDGVHGLGTGDAMQPANNLRPDEPDEHGCGTWQKLRQRINDAFLCAVTIEKILQLEKTCVDLSQRPGAFGFDLEPTDEDAVTEMGCLQRDVLESVAPAGAAFIYGARGGTTSLDDFFYIHQVK